jgi:feruloyl esterase
LLTAAIWDLQAVQNPAARLLPAKVATIEAATLAACDAQDGVTDGVIDNPARCRFDPATLLCKGAESDACLTAPQIDALKKLYSGPVTSGGVVLFPGHAVGGASGGNGWTAWVTGNATGARTVGASFGIGFFANMVFESAMWTPMAFDAERDAKTADNELAATLNATSADLGRFARRGGKLLLYHGWSDPAISPMNSIDYYNAVVAKTGTTTAEKMLRLFMVPGLQHCSGGPGPNEFGQTNRAQPDSEHDINLALERWVEQGMAPAHIIATLYAGGAGGANTVTRTRPLCPYPQVAKWKGAGSTDDAANFTCAAEPPARGR